MESQTPLTNYTGATEQLGTAAIAPEQVGLAKPFGPALAPFASEISGTLMGQHAGTVGVGSFTGVTDVMGGAPVSKYPNLNVRAGLMKLYPDRFLVELIGGPDLGKNALATINLPAGLTPTSESGLTCISLAPSSSGGGGS